MWTIYIGVYCSGFVSSYVAEVLGYPEKAPGVAKDNSREVRTSGLPPHMFRRHDGRKARILEASLDGGYRGLEISNYALHEAKPKPKAYDVFKVTRGLPCKRTQVEVFIVSPWVPPQ